MSANDGDSDTGVQVSQKCSESSLLLTASPRPERQHRACQAYKVRKVRSRGALLLLLWNVAGSCANVFPVFVLDSLSIFTSETKDKLVAGIVLGLVWVVYAPIAGLVSDFYFGRYKFLHYSVLLVWVTSVLSVVVLLVEYVLPGSTTALDYSILAPACVVITAGLVGVYVVLMPFGMDQMPDGSSEEISTFIHWLIWTHFLGVFLSSLGTSLVSTHTGSRILMIILFVVIVLSSSVILCTNYLLRSWFVVEPCCRSPVKTIAGVLRYALTHKYPVRRSALTYWEDGIPSRIDLGKTKYGGPFTNEQVEDVKTLFRVVIVTACIVAFVIPAEAMLISISPYHYAKSSWLPIFTVLDAVCIALIPVYELCIYPLAHTWIPRSLKRVVFFAFLTITVSIYLMMLDIVGQSQADATVPCLFLANKTSPPLPINYNAVVVPVAILIAIQVLAFYIAAFEFICAQSPYHMRGLVIGFGVMIINLASCLADTSYFLWSHNWTVASSEISCGTWYYLFTMVIGFVGLVLLMAAVRWYKERERDDIVDEYRFAEVYSEKGLLHSQQ